MHVEQRIRDQFPSSQDAALLRSFHEAEWTVRPSLVRRLADDRLRELGRKRLIYVERPDLLDAVERLELESWTKNWLLGYGPDGPRSLGESYREVCDLIEDGGHEDLSLLREVRTWLSEKLKTASPAQTGPRPSSMSAVLGQRVKV